MIWTCLTASIKVLWKLANALTVQDTFLYWNTLKTQHLIQCQFLPEEQIIPVIDNEMDKSDQLACIQKSKRFGLKLPWHRENSRVTQHLKVTELHKK